MQYDGTVVFNTKIDDSQLDVQISNVGKHAETGFGKLRDVMQGPIAAFKEAAAIVGKLSSVFDTLEGQWSAQESASAILKSTLKATGAEAWTCAENVEALASKMQKLTGYADDDVLAMQNVLLGFKSIKGDNFDEATLQIVNMSKVMRMDLVSSAQAVGKALDDPIQGVDSLRRQGFFFTEEQKKTLKTLVETGQKAKAQQIILEELATTYGGAAEAANQTGSAIKQKLNVAISELQEELGRFVTESLKPARENLIKTVDALTAFFKKVNESPEAKEKLQNLAVGVEALTAAVVTFLAVSKGSAAIDGLSKAINMLWLAITTGAGPWALALAAITAAVIALIGAANNHREALESETKAYQNTIDKANSLATEYENLAAKQSLTKTEQSRLDELSQALLDKYPTLTEETIKLAAANGTLAEKVNEAAAAQGKKAAAELLPQKENRYVQAVKELANYSQILGELEKLPPGGTYLGISKVETERYRGYVASLRKEIGQLQTDIENYKNIIYGTPTPTPSKNTPPPKNDTGTGSTAKTQGSRLKELDEEYETKIELAKRAGEVTTEIEKEYYDKRLALLGDFVVEDAKKNISVDKSLESGLAGYVDSSTGKLKVLGKEIEATRQKKYALANEGGPIQEDASTQQESVDEWVSRVLGEAAFKQLMDNAEKGIQQAEVDEWIAKTLGDAAFKALMDAAEQALQQADVDDFIERYLGGEQFKKIMDAATQYLEDEEVDEFTKRYLAEQEADKMSRDKHFYEAHFKHEAKAEGDSEAFDKKQTDREIDAEERDKHKFEAHFKNEELADQVAESQAAKQDQRDADAYYREQHFYEAHFRNEAKSDEVAEQNEANQAERDADKEERDKHFYEAHFKNEEEAEKRARQAELNAEERINRRADLQETKLTIDEKIWDKSLGGPEAYQQKISDLVLQLSLQSAELRNSKKTLEENIDSLIASARAAGIDETEIEKLRDAYTSLKKAQSLKDIKDYTDQLKKNIQAQKWQNAGLDANLEKMLADARAAGATKEELQNLLDLYREYETLTGKRPFFDITADQLDKIAGSISSIGGALSSLADDSGEVFSNMASVLTNAIKAYKTGGSDISSIMAIIESLASLADSAGLESFDELQDKVANIADEVLSGLSPLLDFIVERGVEIAGIIEDYLPLITSILKIATGLVKIFDALLLPLKLVTEIFLPLFTSVLTAFAKLFIKFYNGVIVPVGNAIIIFFNKIYNGIVSVINWAINQINSVLSALGLATIATIAYKKEDEGTLTPISVDEGDETSTDYADELQSANEELKENKELFTDASNAADAYASELTKVVKAASAFYDSLKDIGTDIADTLISNLVDGLSGDDFMYAIEEYIRKAVIEAAVYTASMQSQLASIGTAIAKAIASGSTDYSSITAMLQSLYENASSAAAIAEAIIEDAFSSYDVGTLSVRGDQYAKVHNGEMILPSGISEEARKSGITISPNTDYIGKAGLVAASRPITVTSQGVINIDGREVGRAAWQHTDEFAGAAYGY